MQKEVSYEFMVAVASVLHVLFPLEISVMCFFLNTSRALLVTCVASIEYWCPLVALVLSFFVA